MGRGCSNMRPAELARVAKPVACCGKVSRDSGRGRIAQGGMWPTEVAVGDPLRDLRFGVAEAEEQRFIEQFVAQAAIEALAKPLCMGFPGAMKCQATVLSCAQASMARDVNSVPLSETIGLGLPRRSTSAVSSRAARRPERGVGDGRQAFARHVVDDIENAEPSAVGELIVREVRRPASVLPEPRPGSAFGFPWRAVAPAACEPQRRPPATADRYG